MREIKFRGKDKYGVWHYGGYVDYLGKPHIVNEVNDGPLYALATEQVIPETLGQYTGLKDANDVEIYEGDVLQKQWSNGEITYIRVVFREGTFIAHQWYKIDNELSCTECTLRNIDIPTTCVINNVHDAPELMKK